MGGSYLKDGARGRRKLGYGIRRERGSRIYHRCPMDLWPCGPVSADRNGPALAIVPWCKRAPRNCRSNLRRLKGRHVHRAIARMCAGHRRRRQLADVIFARDPCRVASRQEARIESFQTHRRREHGAQPDRDLTMNRLAGNEPGRQIPHIHPARVTHRGSPLYAPQCHHSA